VTASLLLHDGRWRPGSWEVALLEGLAAKFKCTATQAKELVAGRDGTKKDCGRLYTITGPTKSAVDEVVASYTKRRDELLAAAANA
jgi:hypothetical protein